MLDARRARAQSGHMLLRMLVSHGGVFGRIFRKKDAAAEAPEPTVTQRVVLEGYRPPPPPPPKETPPDDPLKRQLLFQRLHENTNPSESVRTSRMTCPACTHEFRYFINSNGRATTVRCPSCTKTYRV